MIDAHTVLILFLCNRLEPLTETRAEYMTWARRGGPATEIVAIVLEPLKKAGKSAELAEASGSSSRMGDPFNLATV
jgi:hypothetical protein